MGQMDNSTAPATVGTVSARNYRPLRMVVISLLPELSRYPGDNAGARRGRFLLGDPLVVLRFGAEYARRLGVNRVVRDTWTSR